MTNIVAQTTLKYQLKFEKETNNKIIFLNNFLCKCHKIYIITKLFLKNSSQKINYLTTKLLNTKALHGRPV